MLITLSDKGYQKKFADRDECGQRASRTLKQGWRDYAIQEIIQSIAFQGHPWYGACFYEGNGSPTDRFRFASIYGIDVDNKPELGKIRPTLDVMAQAKEMEQFLFAYKTFSSSSSLIRYRLVFKYADGIDLNRKLADYNAEIRATNRELGSIGDKHAMSAISFWQGSTKGLLTSADF